MSKKIYHSHWYVDGVYKEHGRLSQNNNQPYKVGDILDQENCSLGQQKKKYEVVKVVVEETHPEGDQGFEYGLAIHYLKEVV